MLSSRLRDLRKLRGLSRSQVATAVGVTPMAVGRWERNEVSPGLDTIVRLADFFEVTTDYLLGRSVEEGTSTTATLPHKLLEAAEWMRDYDDALYVREALPGVVGQAFEPGDLLLLRKVALSDAGAFSPIGDVVILRQLDGKLAAGILRQRGQRDDGILTFTGPTGPPTDPPPGDYFVVEQSVRLDRSRFWTGTTGSSPASPDELVRMLSASVELPAHQLKALVRAIQAVHENEQHQDRKEDVSPWRCSVEVVVADLAVKTGIPTTLLLWTIEILAEYAQLTYTPPNLATQAEAARVAKVSREYVRQLVERGILTGYPRKGDDTGKAPLVSVPDLVLYVHGKPIAVEVKLGNEGPGGTTRLRGRRSAVQDVTKPPTSGDHDG